jgi:2-oxoisovalerate dehydrogenase E1 component
MLRARLADEKSIVLYKQNKCHFQIGCAGHEGITAAAGSVFRAGKDWFYPYYRDMGLCAALGMTDEEFMMNVMNKEGDPNSHGRQMPMHYGSKRLNIVNQSSPTGTQYLQAVGCAMAIKRKKFEEVVYVSSGEGACSQGDFHEALNWACIERLPVVFVIQNNEYAISVHVSEQLAGESVYKLTAGYEGLTRYEVDGTDYVASYQTIQDAHDRALRGEGPCLIEARVPRLQSHSISDNHLKYRTKESIEREQLRDPIAKLRAAIIQRKIASAAEMTALDEEIKTAIDRAAESAEASPDCPATDALANNYNEPNPQGLFVEQEPTGEESYIVDALNHALDEELTRNPDVFIFGEDVAHGKGGVFTVTAGLTAKHGTSRVFNSPLAESSIAGVAIGMATRGLKPVAEIQFGDYVWTAMMQIRNELAMMKYRSGGDFSCPAVIRIPVGGYIRGACYHSQNIEATFAHFPGLFIAYPSNAADAKGLLKAAIRMNDPVLFLEHKGLYRQVYAKSPEGNADHVVPFGKAKIVRSGTAATIVTWGALVQKSIITARELAEQGVEIEIIDLRTIVPLDMETVVASVKKTGRVLVAHEDVLFGGFGAEIVAQIADQCFTSLDAPLKRVGMKYAAAVPHAGSLEDVVLPQNHDVRAAIDELLAF